MKQSICTGGIWRRNSNMTDIEVIRELADIGYRMFDYTFPGDEVGFENTVYMTDGWEKEAEKLSVFMKENGYTFGQAHIPLGGVFSNPLKSENEELMWKGYIRAFEAASILGAPYMVLHPGMESPDMPKEDFFLKFKAFIDKLLGEVGQLGIKIALENLAPFDPNYRYVQTGKDLCELIEFINHPLVGACWDTGHGNLCRADQYESITSLGKHLLCLHVADNVGQFELGFKAWRMDLHTTPLMSVSGVNFDAVLQALIDIDYEGTFNLEIEDPRPVWKKEFIYNGEKQNKLYYATDEMRKIARAASYQIVSLMLKAYGLDA